jgi:hypothetical protein
MVRARRADGGGGIFVGVGDERGAILVGVPAREKDRVRTVVEILVFPQSRVAPGGERGALARMAERAGNRETRRFAPAATSAAGAGTPMIALEDKALGALNRATMQLGSNGKRFRDQLVNQCWSASLGGHELPKLTERQALYLWSLVYTYRRQIDDPELLALAEQRSKTGELPPIYSSGDLRDPIAPREKKARPHPAARPSAMPDRERPSAQQELF